MMRLGGNVKGISLMEVIITIIIIGVLTSIALPKYIKTTYRVQAAEAKQILIAYYGAAKNYCNENNTPYPAIANLDITVVPKYFNAPIRPAFPQTTCAADGENLVNIQHKTIVPAMTIRIKEDGSMDCIGGSVTDCVNFGF